MVGVVERGLDGGKDFARLMGRHASLEIVSRSLKQSYQVLKTRKFWLISLLTFFNLGLY